MNIHQYEEPTPLEQPRIAYALNNHSFVITENSTDGPYPNLVTCNYDRIVDTAIHFLNNANEREERKKEILKSLKKSDGDYFKNTFS